MRIPEAIFAPLVAATEEVFDTMLAIPLVREAPIESSTPVQANVVATVAFAGHRRGLVVFYSSIGAAREIAGAMLGIPPDTVNGEVPDAIGEITNMVAGTFRNRLAAVEPASAIAVPMVTVGSDFSTMYISAVRRVRCPFEMNGHKISVELILTGEDAGRSPSS
jgi:chemotaxis protein CheX